MYFVIGFAFVLLSGAVATQPAVDAPTAVQECYSPKVWAYCAAQDGSALPPACINPEEPNPDPTKLKLCASSCSCDKLVLDPATQNHETLVPPPSRSYPPPAKVLQSGETTEVPAVEKNLIKTPKFESSFVPSYQLAEYSEDTDQILHQPPAGSTQLYGPNEEVIIDPPLGKQNTILNLDDLPQTENEMFKPDPDSNQNSPLPLQRQTLPSSEENELRYQLLLLGS